MPTRPSLLLVDDDDTFRTVLAGELARRGFETATVPSAAEALAALGRSTADVMLLDLRLPDGHGLDVLRAARERRPGMEVIVLTGHGTIDTAIEAIRLGAFDYVAKPCPLDELEVRVGKALERRSLLRRNTILEDALTPSDPAAEFVGDSPAHRETLALVERVAPTDSTVLVLGETGTGKEVVAKLIHARSGRRDRPFVIVDCAGLHEELLQSELFGHEKGAFTGAVRRKHGLFEVADGGTIFLDEVGEMSLATQAKLLRVLESSSFRRVGGTEEIRVDVRTLAATNRDLEVSVRQKMFREDLYWRLSTIRVRLAALRERPGDVAALAEHFLRRGEQRFGRKLHLSPEAHRALERHPWPGNVRELAHTIDHAIIVADGPTIESRHLPPAVRDGGCPELNAAGWPMVPLARLERMHIERILASAGGHRGRAAELLGISERNLYRKLREYEAE
ncbi:MAG: sigma-54-dependent Fis family transcriptional regulator [Deltaproteobacteria bacterium]|nr:sigma-54-dependent Fis family transcriptional regulator [Deltaproteobacteria bacterium]